MRIIGGLAIGATPVLIGDAIRSERERTREAREFARRIAELRDRDVERAVVEERLRIARDVHDITGHHLSAISLQAAGASRATSDPVARGALERIHRLTSEALGQTRRALGVLRESEPAALAPTPRLEHVEQLLEPARDAGLAVDLRVDGAGRPLSDEIEVCAYRVVQESLTNVVRHASATAVHVRVAYGERELTGHGRRRRRRRPRPARRRHRGNARARRDRRRQLRRGPGPARLVGAGEHPAGRGTGPT